MKTLLVFLSCCFFFSLGFGVEPSISVPDSFMEIVRSGSTSSIVKNYLYKDKTGFSPSINIAIEKIDSSESKYIKAIKANYNGKANYTVSEFPKVSTKSGKGYLFQIDKKQPFGDVRILQMILVQKETAYIVTACALKKEFTALEKDFLKTLSSFSLK